MTLRDLPALNALLNSASALLLVTGYLLVRRRRLDAHRRVMTAALTTSTLFLVSYLVYHFNVGRVLFPGAGTARTIYLAILLTHTVLAMALAPMAVTVFVLARTKRFDRHRRLARITLPIWLYVSVTGVVIYWMLYRVRW